MTANVSPIFVKNITAKGVTWTNSDAASTKKTVTPAVGAEGCRVHSLSICSDDTTSRDFQLFLNDGTTDFLLGTISAVTLAGTNSSNSAINILSKTTLLPWIATDGSFLIPAGWVLKMMNVTQVTAAKTVTVVATCGDY
jgi:hypothetical protein